jgi:hypothetical protein
VKDILIRHDIVHRNGRTKDGGVVDVLTEHVIEVMARVRALAATAEEQLDPVADVTQTEISVDPDDVPFLGSLLLSGAVSTPPFVYGIDQNPSFNGVRCGPFHQRQPALQEFGAPPQLRMIKGAESSSQVRP